MTLFFRYVLFFIVSTLVNPFNQQIFLETVFIEYYFITFLVGTLIGLITKYILYENYIFKDFEQSIENNSKNLLYIHLMESLQKLSFGAL